MQFKIGRNPDNDIILNDLSVSRYHALVTGDNGEFFLQDLNSSCGTFVNGQRINKAKVNSFDNITFGRYNFSLAQIQQMINRGANNSANQFQKISKHIRIGRNSDNDIIINYPYISSHHAEIIISDKKLILRDLNSSNGTYVNKQKITQAQITPDDQIHFGTYKFNLERFSNYFEDTSSRDASNLSVTIKEGVNRVGRARDNDIVLMHPLISAHHAIIIRRGEQYEIEDLNSRNGVFVNGRKITKCNINPNDKVSLGIYPINISAANILKTYRGDIKLDLHRINFSVNNKDGLKHILTDISLSIFPSEFIGLIGPSGSGKTTLMNIINGYKFPSSGEVLVNSTNLHMNYELFRGNIGFVPQDDIIHRELTVYQSLYYSAKLRLPLDTTEEEIQFRIKEILKKLDLEKTKDVIIGTPEKTGISGGQRKRVNLAQELITQPSLLLLDEPTSGLDPKTDKDIMKLLRKLADEGRIILLTTHHITKENFKTFDDIILLASGGKLAYFGPSYPDSMEYFNVNEPEDIFTALEKKGDANKISADYKVSRFHKEFVEKRKLDTKEIEITGKAEKQNKREFGFKQFFTLLGRGFDIKKSDTVNSLVLLAQSPVLGLLIGFALGKGDDTPGLPPAFINPTFVLIVCAIFFGVLNTSREIVSERAIYFRERMVMLKIPSYLFSKYFLLSMVSIFQSVILVAIVYSMCGLEGNIAPIMINIILLSLSSMSLGFLLSALVKTSEAAISLSIFALIPQIIFGGAILHIGKMEGVIKYISYFMISRWSFEFLVRHEGTAQNSMDILESSKIVASADNTGLCVFMIIAWGIIYLAVVAILLKKRDNL